ncbi:MAG: cytochrome C oxidase subunit IV family protein [Armatimonadetes bacterium]|nr:cytochrome C oxidase subunit IV family protein [Armatimonadota bacterium]MDW8121820.1 cytochrome C oxidase subunit IV family protein [Armatimonadota bacterium]
MAHEAEMAEGSSKPHPPVKIYLQVLFLLFLLSTVAYFIDLMQMAMVIKALLLISIALMKAGLIAGYFMHLRFERITLVYVLVAPLILLIGLVAAVMPDGRSVLLSRLGL